MNEYVFRVAKAGYAAMYFIDGLRAVMQPGEHYSLGGELKLRSEQSVPPEMVAVWGDETGLAYPLAQAPTAKLDGYLIDRHEVTNEDYKKFVDA